MAPLQFSFLRSTFPKKTLRALDVLSCFELHGEFLIGADLSALEGNVRHWVWREQKFLNTNLTNVCILPSTRNASIGEVHRYVENIYRNSMGTSVSKPRVRH